MKTVISVLLGLLALTNARVLEQYGINGRVINGEDAQLGEIPFQVSLDLYGHFCGGSIISEYWVLTAAHCVLGYPDNSTKIVAGIVRLESRRISRRSEKIIIHEEYTPNDSYRNDIALIKVDIPFEFSDIVQPATLPKLHVKVKTNSSAVVSGWGSLTGPSMPSSNKLQKATLFIVDPTYCRNVISETHYNIYPTHICASDPSMRRGACTGDSGGPLTVNGVLTGIVSWSIKDPLCGSTKYPDVYTRVSEFVDWISKHTK